MKRKFSIRFKMLVVMLLIYLTTFLFILYQILSLSIDDTKLITDTYAGKFANHSKSKLNEYVEVARTLKIFFESYKSIEEKNRRSVFQKIMKDVLRKNEDFLSVWSTLESNSIDSLDTQYENKAGSTVLGNFGVVYYKNNGNILLDKTIETDTAEVFTGDYYMYPKKTLKELVMNPYYYSYTHDGKNEVLETSIVMPVINDNEKFMGVVGVDVELKRFQKIIENIKPIEKSYAFLVANDGKFIAHPDLEMNGKSISEMYSENDSLSDYSGKIKSGQHFSFLTENKENKQVYVTFAPFYIGKSKTPWSLGIVVPLNIIVKETFKKFYISFLIWFAGFVLLGFAIIRISNKIVNPLKKTSSLIKKISEGDFTVDINIEGNDETTLIMEDLKVMVTKIKEVISFVKLVSNNLADAGSKIRKSSNYISAGANDQMISSQKVVEAISKIQDTLKQNVENTSKVEYSKQILFQQIDQSNRNVSNTISAIKKIAKKNRIIGEIASQTNLLALNARVEASKAGEFGSGFSVIANEIKNLSDHSNSAAEEINEMSDAGVELVEQFGTTLEKIVTDIKKTAEIINQISISTNEQSQNAESINNYVKDLSDITIQFTEASKEMAFNSERLTSHAKQLEKTISFFKFDD